MAFVDEKLKDYLETSSVIRLQSATIAQWNMNISENILQIGNYRYRPLDDEDSRYKNVASSFSLDDEESRFYTDATDADVVVDGGLKERKIFNVDGSFTVDSVPQTFLSKKKKEEMLYSLEDCFGRFRPRSGINKLRYFPGNYTHYTDPDLASRPRYYMADRNDYFKYWTSFRTEEGVERGIANQIVGTQFFIDDACPYVVYKEQVPTNRIVVKMQTGVGTIPSANIFSAGGLKADPFFGEENKTTPVNWKIQYLKDNNWQDAISFDFSSTRDDGSPIIKEDGYVELSYGLEIPKEFRNIFKFVRKYTSENLLPPTENVFVGEAFLIQNNDSDPGQFFILTEEGEYSQFPAKYGWFVQEEDPKVKSYVTDLTNPESFIDSSGELAYREFAYLEGLRVVVTTMNKFESTFDLIELSPRLEVDLSDKTSSFAITRSVSDLGQTGLPVGQLLASIGTIDIFDYDLAFSEENASSIVSKYTSQNLQFKFFEIIVDDDGEVFYVPIKTMYAEGFPQVNSSDRKVSVSLRDLFFYFEALEAPELLIQNASLSYAISLLLDSVGFSNYRFKRNQNDEEDIIPFFFVEPDKSVAEILNDLAVSTQTAMFFDEENNFVCLSRNYMFPEEGQRETDSVLYGTRDFQRNGVKSNEATGEISPISEKNRLANISDISFQNNRVYNDGVINFTSRSIQKTYASLKQANFIDRDKTWIYKPSLLWEVAPTESTKSINNEVSEQSSYVLAAIPLASDLTDQLPEVIDNEIINNVIDLGEGVYWITRYNGYFYANGEIIKYDAVQYNIPGISLIDPDLPGLDGDNVWISSLQDYQKYFAKMPFNGKIFPTGLVRIYTEPNFEVISDQVFLKNGPVAKHGRCQFGTGILKEDGTNGPVFHNAGLSEYWLSDESIKGCLMDSRYLFGREVDFTLSNVFSEEENRGKAALSNSGIQLPVTITSKDSVANIRARSHGLAINDLISFGTNGFLPQGVDQHKLYGVSKIIDGDNFNISEYNVAEERAGASIDISGSQAGIQNISTNSLLDAFTATITNGNPGIINRSNHGLKSGDRIVFSNRIPPGLQSSRVYYVKDVPNSNTFNIALVPGGNPVQISGASGSYQIRQVLFCLKITLNNHRFLTNDSVKFSLGDPGQLPNELEPGAEYFVSSKGLTRDSFSITFIRGTPPISVKENASGEIFLNSGLVKPVIDSTIVVPDATNIEVGYKVEIDNGSGLLRPNTVVISVDKERSSIRVFPKPQEKIIKDFVDPATALPSVNRIRIFDEILTVTGTGNENTIAGQNNQRALSTSRVPTIKNFFSAEYFHETEENAEYPGSMQASALVMTGDRLFSTEDARDFISYVHKDLPDSFTHFGTRMRIVGKLKNDESRGQEPTGSSTYYTTTDTQSNQSVAIDGASGGLGLLINPETNNGYFFEAVALSENNPEKYPNEEIYNLVFYKVVRKADFGSVALLQKSVEDGLATIVTDRNHGFDVGDEIAISGVSEIFNGEHTITEVTAETFSFELSSPNTEISSSGGFARIVNSNFPPVRDVDKAIPIRLWGGIANIIVDDGRFTGQYRMADEENPTVYDLAVEYEDLAESALRRFYLYVNGKIVAIVDDRFPLPVYNNMAVFVRGSSKCMFENLYAVGNNYSKDKTQSLNTPVNSVFGTKEISANDAFQKYALSGMIQSTFLSGISSSEEPDHKIYFEEFGTIMREAAFFDIKYDKAYPALYAMLSPTFNRIKGYVSSGFLAHPYGAEFLIFNATDTALSLDSTSGNYLRIQGIAFTQESENQLSVDEFFERQGDFSNPKFVGQNVAISPIKFSQDYQDIKFSRISQGLSAFTLSAPYIQSYDGAYKIMEWLTQKIMRPRKSVGVKLFGLPTLQLGDLVTIDYKNKEGVNEIGPDGQRFIVYHIEYNRTLQNVSNTVYLSEVG